MNPESNILLYQTEDGRTKLEVRLENETVWITQADMVELFQSSKSNISEHIKHIFDEGELDKDSVVRKFRTTAADGKKYQTSFYNLDVIISVGYRVKSLRGTQFRMWATERLREYLIKGFTMNRISLLMPEKYQLNWLAKKRFQSMRAIEKNLIRNYRR
jgi:hypothetical protein